LLQISLKRLCITLALGITTILFLAILSLFVIPDLKDVITSIKSREMLYSLELSVITASIATILVMLIAIPIGYALARYEFWGKAFVKAILDLPIAFPELVLGLALLLFFGKTEINNLLKLLGIKVVFTKLGIVVAQFFTGLPYAIRIICATFNDINPRYEFVSRSLGYGEFETFKNVSLPLAKSGILAASIITFARCIGAFGAVLILAGGTYMYTEILPITLYLNISYGNLSMAITSGIVLIIVSFLAIACFELLERKNVY